MTRWTKEALVTLVFEILRDDLLTVASEFSSTSSLVDAGLESLTVTQLMLAIEEATGIWVDESLLTPETFESAESVAACVYAQLAKE